ncbi:MAG: HAMP domain-containing protein, partial [Gammaproteobacteria bacterium]|nr:HAMP domain-containing protein [Gammaproteobacteria bacterium]
MSTSLTIQDAKRNVHAEIDSSEKLALYLFEIGVLKNPKYQSIENEFKPFNLQNLVHMRHIRIEFFNVDGKLLDSNISEIKSTNQAPEWFVNLMGAISQPSEPKRLPVVILGDHKGDIVISPDPSYEYGEIWNQVKDTLQLIGFFFILINVLILWILRNSLSPIQHILTSLNQLEEGNFKTRIPYLKTKELRDIGQKFNRMVKVLEESISKNHQLSQQLINLQEAERKKLARDLHDEFGQSLTAIHADAAALKVLANKDYPKIKPSVDAISELSKYLMELVSGMLGRLKLGVLSELGLEEGLIDLMRTWQLRHPKIKLQHDIELKNLPKLNERIAIAAYRIMQECLTNISRHAKAKRVDIKVKYQIKNKSNRFIDINIHDDGIGFSKSHHDGFGLLGIKERIHEIQGKINIVSNSKLG